MKVGVSCLKAVCLPNTNYYHMNLQDAMKKLVPGERFCFFLSIVYTSPFLRLLFSQLWQHKAAFSHCFQVHFVRHVHMFCITLYKDHTEERIVHLSTVVGMCLWERLTLLNKERKKVLALVCIFICWAILLRSTCNLITEKKKANFTDSQLKPLVLL